MSELRTGIFYTGKEYRTVVLEGTSEGWSVKFRSVYSRGEEEKLLDECGSYIKENEVRFTFNPVNFHYKLLEIPFKSPRKIMRVLPIQLEQFVPIPQQEMMTGFYVLNGNVIGIAVRKDSVEELVNSTDAKGLMVDVMTDPAGTFIEWQSEDTALLVWEKESLIISIRKGNVVHIRVVPLPAKSDDIYRVTREVRRSIQSTASSVTHIFLSGEVAVEDDVQKDLEELLESKVEPVTPSTIGLKWPYESREFHKFIIPCSLALAENVYNFRTGALAPSFTKGLPVKQLRIFGVLLFVSLVMLNIGIGVLKKSYIEMLTLLKTRELNIFVETFPEVKKIVDPYLQMKQKVSKISSTSQNSKISFTQVFYTLSKAVRDSQVTLEEVSFFEGNIDIYAYAEEVDLIEAFRKRLSEEDAFEEVKLLLSRREKDRPGFKFRIKGKVRSKQ